MRAWQVMTRQPDILLRGNHRKRKHSKHHDATYNHCTCSGTGTFGRVKLVRSKVNGRHMAMKMLKKREILRMRQVGHVVGEKRVLSMLDHPFIVKL